MRMAKAISGEAMPASGVGPVVWQNSAFRISNSAVTCPARCSEMDRIVGNQYPTSAIARVHALRYGKRMMRWLVLCMALVPVIAAGEVYRWVDEQGNVVYSDQPREGAETVELPEITTYKPASAPAPAADQAGGEAGGETGKVYELRIVTPAPDATVRDNRGQMEVQLAAEPALHTDRGHRFALQVDDQSVQYTRAPVIQLTDVHRGTHTLQAWVIDRQDNPLSDKVSATFHMHQASRLHPQPRNLNNPTAPATP